jgi:hypothetical protein
VGERLADLDLRSCDDEVVPLSDFCGAGALWIFGASAWCPLCQAVSAEMEAVQAEYAASGLVSIAVVIEQGVGEAPDASNCSAWRAKHGHESVFTLHDPLGVLQPALWPEGSSSLSAFVDGEGVIRGKLVHESNLDTIRDGIEAALAP